jgi:ubiquinone/menaquinone biosynthesis C-methylase UbiE
MDYRKRLIDGFSPMAKRYDRVLSLITFGKVQEWQLELLSMIPHKNILLDLGTGTGGIPLLAVSKGFKKVIGLDFVFEMLEEARKKNPSIPFINGDILQLPVKDRSVGALTLSFCFRYIPHPQRFLKEARRILNNNGRIAILDVCRTEERSFIASIIISLFKKLFSIIRLFRGGKEHPLKRLEQKYTIEEIKELLHKNQFSVTCEKRYFYGMIALILAE